MECLLDTGALRTRMSAELAPLAGIELTGSLTAEFCIGRLKTTGALARVSLTVTDGTDDFSWDAGLVLRAMAASLRPGRSRGLLSLLPRDDPRL
jgi:hypothetical protein